jgi:nucleoside 2-deoxyribosyltransferase
VSKKRTKVLKVYVASHDQNTAIIIADAIRDAGHKIVSTWLEEDMTAPLTASCRARIAAKDLREIRKADVLVLEAAPVGCHVPGGKHVELGYALALGKTVLVVGRKENIFHWHDDVHVFASTYEAVARLSGGRP